ncbi:alpha/beta hydrolase [Lentisphaera profundi]|uniref:Alpha/beta hydrolase n=1 Tax=Lentisphaera profundi TaxID=1658616 RepID=A0ABY7VT77_9BACT|nr:alpha/beta hydrolase [Lentisphaera profundi]WDE96509.1 alpha/beta hydrolase [Lentisphaera profundi]
MKVSIILGLVILLSLVSIQVTSASEKIPVALLNDFDINKDGNLDKSERVNILKKFDADKNGKLDKNERAVLAKKYKKQSVAKASGAPEGGEKRIYKKVSSIDLPLYIYKPINHTENSKAPAIVFFFGGGWKSGSPNQFEKQCKHLASKGMVAITVEYRVSSRHDVKIEDCVEDAKSAMRWVRKHANELGIDPERIATSGGSAGGHLAACVSVIEGFNAESDDLKVSAQPNAMVLFNPAMVIADHEKLPKKYKELLEKTLKDRSAVDRTLISPLHHAHKKQPPCIMFFGTADRLIEGAKIYCEISKEAGNQCQILSYEGQGHGFFNAKRTPDKYYQLTLKEMDKFFMDLDWIK